MNITQFNKVTNGVKIFFGLIGKIDVPAAKVMRSDPHEYAMALRAAAGAAGCPASQLSLVIFGRTLNNYTNIRNRKFGYVQAVELRQRLECVGSPADLVRLTFGESTQPSNNNWHDRTAVLFS